MSVLKLVNDDATLNRLTLNMDGQDPLLWSVCRHEQVATQDFLKVFEMMIHCRHCVKTPGTEV